MKLSRLVIFVLLLQLSSCETMNFDDIYIEAEAFENTGGWVNDTQSMMQTGSPYLLAHGFGEPVADAVTSFSASSRGEYHLWVRTRDWVKHWGAEGAPGRFQVLVNGSLTDCVFGTESAEWAWQYGGTVKLECGENTIALHDLTGFDGRCDAIFLSKNPDAAPPCPSVSFEPDDPEDAGSYDLVIAGGGIAGCCAAISAARLGCKVALLQNRPVLGGNNSSEVRVGLSGRIFQEPYPKLGALMDELGGVGYWNNVEAEEDPDNERSKRIMEVLREHPEKHIHNGGPASNYEDDRKLSLIESEPNISLFLNTQVIAVKKKGGRIVSLVGRDINDGKDVIVSGSLFADCTGDGDLGYLAGADYRMGRESRQETGEKDAPEYPDSLTMGMSVLWYAEDTPENNSFPECEWALRFDEKTGIVTDHGEWQWECGLNDDQITEAEYIRDHALRSIYGNWAYVKNHSAEKDAYASKRLKWVAFVGGKRESRRLLGDHILTETDLTEPVVYDDASFTTTWGIDIHYPDIIPGFEGDPFLAISKSPAIKPYAVPYRCLYSRNIENLFMAGRDISVTHVALGTVRVMRTCGMMGEVVGMAASICKRNNCSPRTVYEKHFDELKRQMSDGTPNRRMKYTDASSLTLVGKLMPTSNQYHRVDTNVYKGFDDIENLELRSPAGMAVAFKTNSDKISILSQFGEERAAPYTMLLSSRGYDLYIKDGNEWVWAASNALWPNERDKECVLIDGMEQGTEKECLLYLPIFTELYSCMIGVSEGYYIEPGPEPFRHKIVFYGSSFTQGTSTSRSGMAYPLQFGRMTGLGVASLGMGGRCLMQETVSDVLVDVEADAFVFDTFSNPPLPLIKERLFPFIDKMCSAHPGVPLIFQQSQILRQCRFIPSHDKAERERMKQVSLMMEEAVSKYPDVYFIKPDVSGQMYDATVDGVHFDDYGYYLWARSIVKPITGILRKYGIR